MVIRPDKNIVYFIDNFTIYLSSIIGYNNMWKFNTINISADHYLLFYENVFVSLSRNSMCGNDFFTAG